MMGRSQDSSVSVNVRAPVVASKAAISHLGKGNAKVAPFTAKDIADDPRFAVIGFKAGEVVIVLPQGVALSF